MFRGGAPEALVVAGIAAGTPCFAMRVEVEWGARFLAPWGLMNVEDE